MRVSTDDQNPENQRALMQRRCDSEDWEARWYVDKESGKSTSRADFTRLVTDALNGVGQIVHFWALDRMARDQLFMIQQIRALEAAGIKVVSATESWVEHADDDFRPVLLGLQSGYAESELRRLSRRTGAGLDTALAKGRRLGRPLKSSVVLAEAASLVKREVEPLSLREAVAQVNRGLDKAAQISVGTLHRYLRGEWEGARMPTGNRLRLLREAARLMSPEGGRLPMREAVARVNRGLPRTPAEPGGPCRISTGALQAFLRASQGA